jgi:hypothetical protein
MPRPTNPVKSIKRENISLKRYICIWKRVIIIRSIDLPVSGVISGKCVVWVGGAKNPTEGFVLLVSVVLVEVVVGVMWVDHIITLWLWIEWAALLSLVLVLQGRTIHEVVVPVWEHALLQRLHPPPDRAVLVRGSPPWCRACPSLQDHQVISFTNIEHDVACQHDKPLVHYLTAK